MKGFFITGTDTNVGKSYFGSLLVADLFNEGLDVQPRKPIESGCISENEKLLPVDGMAYHLAVNKTIDIDTITPYRFSPALAPPQTMSKNNHVNLEQLTEAVYKSSDKNSTLVVEGAGGIYSPLCTDGLNIDLAKKLNLPVILVINNQVGCINHCLLSIEALIKHNLEIAALVLNDTKDKQTLLDDNFLTIQNCIRLYPNNVQEKLTYLNFGSNLNQNIKNIIKR